MKVLKQNSKTIALGMIILFGLASCVKEKETTPVVSNDSVIVSVQESVENIPDSMMILTKDSMINNAPKTKEVLANGVAREEKDRVIIRMADGQRLPFTIGEKFTATHDKLILKITDVNPSQIKATLKTKNPQQNIRFNQIKLPDGTMDGPFGKELSYTVKEKGEVWLIIGKDNMAEGTIEGDFSVTVE